MEEDNNNIDFVNSEFLQEALQNHTKDPDLRVLDFTVEPATAKGDNYMSVLYRASIDYTRKRKKKSQSVIIKIAPSGTRSEMVCFLKNASEKTKLCILKHDAHYVNDL